MTITGAGHGIMEAGHVGAGRDNSFGLNILLPFEQSANPVMTGNDKLMTMRYFFTRKLMFVKETDAVVLFPGGFGTHDEAFEALTLIQTGKVKPIPIIFFGKSFWERVVNFEALAEEGVISADDLKLFTYCENAEEAWDYVCRHYAGTPDEIC